MRGSVRVTAGLLGLAAVLTGCTAPETEPSSQGSGATTGGSAAPDTEPDTEPVPEVADLRSVFGGQVTAREDGSFGLDRWSSIEDGPPGSDAPAMRVTYPAGSVSPSATREHDAPEGGMQVFLPLVSDPPDSAHLRYWVRFPENFEFVKGGKLPGLYGGTEVSGGEEPDGTDGFSTRLMWRSDGEGEVYLYAPDESGTSLGRGKWTFPRGTWTCVEQRVVLNDPEGEDGSVTVWVDGTEVFQEKGMRYRSVDDLHVEGIFFSTFYGGADPSWAPSADQHADFAGFAVSDKAIGCS